MYNIQIENWDVTCILPINVDEAETARLAAIFNYQVGNLPFTYLGLPVGTTNLGFRT